MRDVEELNLNEPAEALHISVTNVKVRLHRAYDVAEAFGPSTKKRISQIKEEVAPMVIDCKHVWNYISDYLDDTLTDEIRSTVQKHLEHCEICSAILDSNRNILILIADDRVFELPISFSERLHTRIDLELARRGAS